MGYIKCVACPAPQQCDEEGQCVNTWVTAQDRRGTTVRFNNPPPTGTVVSVPLPTASASPSPAKAPPSAPRAPGGGTVTDQIFAECEAQLADLHRSGKSAALAEAGKLFQTARERAILVLEARGVNINSARKGSGMWVRERAAST